MIEVLDSIGSPVLIQTCHILYIELEVEGCTIHFINRTSLYSTSDYEYVKNVLHSKRLLG